MTSISIKCFRLSNFKFIFGGVTGYLPTVLARRTAESDAWTFHRAISLNSNNGSQRRSAEPESTTGHTMNYPYEDAEQLGYDKSEESYKEWDKYWTVVQTDKTESYLTVTEGTSIDWKDHTAQTNGDGDSKNGRRWIFSLRHGERVDLTYGHWVQHCFNDNGTYVRKDLNLPLTLGERKGGKDAYEVDSPLTRIGQLQAQLVGEGLRLAGVSVSHVYTSCALRCVETAHEFLKGLQADPSVKIRVEPGLFEYKMWHLNKENALTFMTPLELHKAGYNVDVEYKPYIDLGRDAETLEEYYERGEKVVQSVYRDISPDDGNIIFVGHAATLDVTAIALNRLRNTNTDRQPYEIDKNLLRVPYCALSAVRDNPLQLVAPPCPPSINSSSGRYDWKILLDMWKNSTSR